MLLQRKLRLPLSMFLPTPTCPHCKHRIDALGDHYFSCKFSKTNMHNHIRNTLFKVLQATTTLAGYTTTPADVLLEPINLIPSAPLRRPADVAIRLHSTNNTHNYAAIDVSIAPITASSTRESLRSTKPKTYTEAHLRVEKAKFSGRSSDDVTAQQLIQQLNHHGITLYPFSVDHLGGIGPLARSLLFKQARSPFLSEDATTRNFPHEPALQAFSAANDNPLAILTTATSAWTYMYHRNTTQYFGSTHASKTPSQWAVQVLALNISKSISLHLYKHAQTHYLTHSNSPTINIVGTPPTTYAVQPAHFVYMPGAHSQPHVFYV